MKYRYTYETEFDVPKYCWKQEYKNNSMAAYKSDICPFFGFRGIECTGQGIASHCECNLVPWTGEKKTPKFKIENGKRWERCPLSRKREVEEG